MRAVFVRDFSLVELWYGRAMKESDSTALILMGGAEDSRDFSQALVMSA